MLYMTVPCGLKKRFIWSFDLSVNSWCACHRWQYIPCQDGRRKSEADVPRRSRSSENNHPFSATRERGLYKALEYFNGSADCTLNVVTRLCNADMGQELQVVLLSLVPWARKQYYSSSSQLLHHHKSATTTVPSIKQQKKERLSDALD
ncbi:hypothetical protein PAXRUDRAFT_329229 [Paxillus rubicundulus Ve08.2h10]|uniref:Uncharacterized protein n=1 Tax=Paxillus rubicundulus Ve08.2h10 TaxID=930991 RepID=A0A0D0ECX8_9AGAM|nr:hypothetical protein PAXRUDRAFT_329229 [Paxillus rubicundulus Ve08.2h10]